MTQTPVDTYTKQIDEYFGASVSSEDDDPLQYWKLSQSQFPELSKLACKHLHVPASSAPVERLFSIAGKVFRPDRSNMTDQRFEMLMFIGCNTRKLAYHCKLYIHVHIYSTGNKLLLKIWKLIMVLFINVIMINNLKRIEVIVIVIE